MLKCKHELKAESVKKRYNIIRFYSEKKIEKKNLRGR